MFIDTYGASLSGVLPLQHRHYNRPYGGLPGWDLDFRAHKRCVRITGRWDTSGGIGHWEIDRKSVGDLIGGFCWLQESKDTRPVAAWSFAFPVVITGTGPSQLPEGWVATPGRQKGEGLQMLPQRDADGAPDTRLKKITVRPQVFLAKKGRPDPAVGFIDPTATRRR